MTKMIFPPPLLFIIISYDYEKLVPNQLNLVLTLFQPLYKIDCYQYLRTVYHFKTLNKMKNSNAGKVIGNYELGKAIGQGTFGKVRLGRHLITKEFVAIKILEKKKINDVSDIERVAREIHILKLIRHPNIVQLYEIIETSDKLYLIMEYASGGEVFEYIVTCNYIKESEA